MKKTQNVSVKLLLLTACLCLIGFTGHAQHANAEKKATVKTLKLSKTQYVLKKGNKVKLKAQISPKNAKKTKVVWRSSNSKCLRVNSKGVVTAKAKKGNAVITAKAGKKKATCKITIGKPVKKLKASNMALQLGETKKLKVTISPTKATIKKLAYKSSNSSVVRVNKNGMLQARKEGNATITIWAKDCMKVSKKVNITVTGTDTPPSDSTQSTVPSTPPSESVKTGALSGIVKAKQGNSELEALANARVIVYDQEKKAGEATTSAEGTFLITDLDCSKTYRLSIEKDGFKTLEIENISIRAGETTTLSENGTLALLSKSVALISENTNVAIISEDIVTAPSDLAIADILEVLKNPEGGTVTIIDNESTQLQVVSEDGIESKNYILQLVDRASALAEGTDYTIDYAKETLQVASTVETGVKYRFGKDSDWIELSKETDCNAYKTISLTDALAQEATLYICRSKQANQPFDALITEIELKRQTLTRALYYQISCLAGLRYGLESGVLNKEYNMYLSTSTITDYSQIPENDIIKITYTGIDEAGTYYESSTNYSHVYIQKAATDSEFASAWVKAEYQSRDNEFDIDDIP